MIKTARCTHRVSALKLITNDELVEDAKILKMKGDQIFRSFDMYLTYKTEKIKYHGNTYTLKELEALLDAKLYIDTLNRVVRYKPQIIIHYVVNTYCGSQKIQTYRTNEEALKAYENYNKIFELEEMKNEY